MSHLHHHHRHHHHHKKIIIIIVVVVIIITNNEYFDRDDSPEYPLTTLKILLLISWSNSHIKIYTCNKLQHPCWYHQFYFRCKKPKVILTKVPAQKFLNIGKIYICQEFLLCIKSMLCVKIFSAFMRYILFCATSTTVDYD